MHTMVYLFTVLFLESFNIQCISHYSESLSELLSSCGNSCKWGKGGGALKGSLTDGPSVGTTTGASWPFFIACLFVLAPRSHASIAGLRYWYWSSIPLILSRSDKVLCSIRVFCYERLSIANCSAEITRDIWVSLERHTQKHESGHNICKSCGELVYLCSRWSVVVKTRPVRYPVRYYDLTYKNIVLLKKANQS